VEKVGMAYMAEVGVVAEEVEVSAGAEEKMEMEDSGGELVVMEEEECQFLALVEARAIQVDLCSVRVEAERLLEARFSSIPALL